MNAKIAGHAGTPQLKQFHTVNIKMFRHPKYYKELRKRNKSDQIISPRVATASARRASGPGLKLRHGGLTPEASGTKLQATSKPEPVQVQQASSAKRQASQSE